jgi:hypothetical protein
MDELLSHGRHSVVLDAVACHKDSYSGKTTREEHDYLQSSFILLSGKVSQISIKHYTVAGAVPPGVSTFPRFKVFTRCHGMSDVELHGAREIVHFASRQDGSVDRGSWYHCKQNKKYTFYSHGSAITRILS